MKKWCLLFSVLFIMLFVFGSSYAKAASIPFSPLTTGEMLLLEQDLTVLQTQLIIA